MRPGLDGAQAGLPCAPPRRKKNAAATGRGRGGSRSPVVRHTAHSKRPLDQQRSVATDGGRGGASPPHGTLAHASPSRHERAPSPLHAQCLRPRSTRGDVRQATASCLWWLLPRGGRPPGTRSASRRGPQGARPVGPRASAPPHAGHRGTSCWRQIRSWPRQDASRCVIGVGCAVWRAWQETVTRTGVESVEHTSHVASSPARRGARLLACTTPCPGG